jgi:hypothetical protein
MYAKLTENAPFCCSFVPYLLYILTFYWGKNKHPFSASLVLQLKPSAAQSCPTVCRDFYFYFIFILFFLTGIGNTCVVHTRAQALEQRWALKRPKCIRTYVRAQTDVDYILYVHIHMYCLCAATDCIGQGK